MRITILNGNPNSSDTGFDTYLKKLSDRIESNGHKTITLCLRDLDIHYCTGCFGCWIKTPGECANAADDSRKVRHEVINSDLVIFASPIIMGFTSALLKQMHDKFVPLVLPYIGLFDGESHHLARYDKYPLMALLLQPDADTDEEDIRIITDIYRRNSLNFKSSFVFSRLTTDPVNEVADEINRL